MVAPVLQVRTRSVQRPTVGVRSQQLPGLHVICREPPKSEFGSAFLELWHDCFSCK